MLEEHTAQVAEAFSRKSQVYDAFGEGHPNLTRMREKVRRHILSFLQPGDRILELNAGTGLDAAFFASLGYSIHATDLSPGMLASIEQKITALGLEDRLSAQLCSFEDLEKLAGRSYNYVFSNLGGVNCTPDLHRLASAVEQLLLPSGRVTWVVMPPVCLWELAQLLRGHFSTALRRLQPHGTLANVEGLHFTTWYYPPGHVLKCFGTRFRLLHIQGLSVFTPPADHKYFPIHHPSVYKRLCQVDQLLADRYPFNRWGDFYILTLEKSPG
jgi:ubiquinone/menaquinone biosynthesis C-methylase UbiE